METLTPPAPRYPSKELREAVYRRDGRRCLHCGTADNLTTDHVIPWSEGGPTTLDNLQTLCRDCNRKKGPWAVGRKMRPLPEADAARLVELATARDKADAALVRAIVRLHNRGESLGAIAAPLGVTRQAVQQRLKLAKARARTPGLDDLSLDPS